jgi:hypothetical protein
VNQTNIPGFPGRLRFRLLPAEATGGAGLLGPEADEARLELDMLLS